MRTVHILIDAADEAAEATGWYERERPGLGRDFEAAVDAAMDLRACEPIPSTVMYGESGARGARRIVLKRFPYDVVFFPKAIKSGCSPLRTIPGAPLSGAIGWKWFQSVLNGRDLRRSLNDGATSSQAGAAASASEASKPLRFVLRVSLRNKPGDTVNPTCYSNEITRAGPPGWGAPGFLPPGSGQQAIQSIESLKGQFIPLCSASGREITRAGNFNWQWNLTQYDEQQLAGARARHREDVTVSLD